MTKKLLDISGHLGRIEQIKFYAENNPIDVQELADKAAKGDVSFPANRTVIIPQGWHVGYVVEEQAPPNGTWRRLRVSIGGDDIPPQAGVIELMKVFGFVCPPELCLWIADESAIDVAVCVLEPLEGIAKLEEFLRRMMRLEQYNEALCRA